MANKAEAAKRPARDFMPSPVFSGLRTGPAEAQFAEFPVFPGIFPEWREGPWRG
jgi:hypothetical protein